MDDKKGRKRQVAKRKTSPGKSIEVSVETIVSRSEARVVLVQTDISREAFVFGTEGESEYSYSLDALVQKIDKKNRRLIAVIQASVKKEVSGKDEINMVAHYLIDLSEIKNGKVNYRDILGFAAKYIVWPRFVQLLEFVASQALVSLRELPVVPEHLEIRPREYDEIVETNDGPKVAKRKKRSLKEA